MKRTLRLALTLALAAAPFTTFAAAPKKVIVCTVTTGFRHSSIPEAEKTLQKLADESKAFVVVDWVRQPDVKVPKKPGKPKEPKADADEKAKAKYAEELKNYEAEMAKWTPEKEAEAKALADNEKELLKAQMAKLSPANLAKVDGVIFANTTGDDYPLPDRAGFFKWIEGGGAFIGMHSATDTFKTFEPYYDMIQGTFNGHGAQVPAALINADKTHPANAPLPEEWKIDQEEMYLIKNHDRAKLRALLYMRHHPNKPEEAGYFPVAWNRQAGKGRVFYTSLGHREDLWSDDPNLKDRKNPVETSKLYQQHILGGIKWALGLAEGSSTPNPDAK
jgi:type 1 glutamine amidotransferase